MDDEPLHVPMNALRLLFRHASVVHNAIRFRGDPTPEEFLAFAGALAIVEDVPGISDEEALPLPACYLVKHSPEEAKWKTRVTLTSP